MQWVSSRIWTRVTVFISYDDNHYTTGTSKTPRAPPKHHGHLQNTTGTSRWLVGWFYTMSTFCRLSYIKVSRFLFIFCYMALTFRLVIWFNGISNLDSYLIAKSCWYVFFFKKIGFKEHFIRYRAHLFAQSWMVSYVYAYITYIWFVKE